MFEILRNPRVRNDYGSRHQIGDGKAAEQEEKFVNAAAKVCSNSNVRIASPSCCNLCNAPIPCHRKLASLYLEITETAV
jgi:hypothetical protein